MPELPRRALLGRTALTVLAASAADAATLGSRSPPPVPLDRMRCAVSRTALGQLADVVAGECVYLSEARREGVFRLVRAAAATPDPLEGLSVAGPRPGERFVRVWDEITGHPEWFGARPNDGDADCVDAIEACVALCPVTELAATDYFTRRTVHLQSNGRTLRGVGGFAEGPGRGTRIILHRAAPGIARDDILLVGSRAPVAVPGPAAVTDCHIECLTLVRDGPCTPHPSGDLVRYAAGLRAAFIFHCSFRQISSLESSVGFYIGGVVYTKLDDCYAVRLRPGTRAANDFAVGYYLDGHISFGYAGGNASLYLNRCAVSDQHPHHVAPTGLVARGAFVDTFLDNFETARVDTGIAASADGALGIGNTGDLHIRSPVLDGCGRAGIDLDLGGTTGASIEIIDPYIYATATGGRFGIGIRDGAGLVTLTGGQIHGDFADGSLRLSRTRGVRIQGTKIHQAVRPIVAEASSGLIIEPQINNSSKWSPAFAITCHGVARSIIRPVVIGAGGPAFAGGVDLDNGCNHIAVDGSAIDPACFAVPDAAFKLHYAGGDARLGATAEAFVAAGNTLAGVTC